MRIDGKQVKIQICLNNKAEMCDETGVNILNKLLFWKAQLYLMYGSGLRKDK